ncbi:MAG: BatA domain-containing protein [Phycisphaerae bacterium]|nr:BatA domain-containing protein [Phycisphaerae bacterium]
MRGMPAGLLLADLTFLSPGLWWGALACAAPIIIHLVMRQRPRRQLFPAIRFLIQSQRASVRQHRLRNWLLLLARVALILALVAALARPIVRGAWVSPVGRAETAAVLLIDDSASMGYRFGQQTRSARAVAQAQALVRDASRFPPGSSLLALSASQSMPAEWQTSLNRVQERLDAMGEPLFDRPLTAGVDVALSRLAESPLSNKELYVFTDMTVHAWAGASSRRWSDGPAVRVHVFDVGDPEDRNVRITALRGLNAGPPPRTPQRVAVTVSTGDEPAHDRLEVTIDEHAVGRSDVARIAPRSAEDVTVTIPSLEPGLHVGAVRWLGRDSLSFDDVAYFAIDAREPPDVLVLSDGSAVSETEARRIAAMLCPPTLPPDRRRFIVNRQNVAASAIAANKIGRHTALAVVADAPRPHAAAARMLEEWVRGGGHALFVAGPRSAASKEHGWGALLPVALDGVLAPTGPLRIAAAEPSDAERFAMFRDAAVDRAVRCRPIGGARTIARFSDGGAAMVDAAVGKGTSQFWAFSLSPDWGDLGVRAGPAMMLLHQLAGSALQVSRRVGNVVCGDALTLIPETATSAALSVVGNVIGGGRREIPLGGARLRGGISVPTSMAGAYRVVDPVDAQKLPIGAYAVALHAEETDGRRIPPERVCGFFAPDAAVVMRDVADLSQPTLEAAGDRDLFGLALALLLALVLAEWGLANRRAGRVSMGT